MIMQNIEKIHLPIGSNYVAHWGLWEAVREILQNAIDTANYTVKKSELSGNMIISSNGGKLDVSTLMLGESTKRDDSDLIGKYGEGYKLAMLVLSRAGYDVRVSNGQDLWLASIEPHPQLLTDSLCISIQKDYFDEDNNNEVSFVINGLSEQDFIEIKEKYITVDDINPEAESDGSHCFNYPYSNETKLFVGGLFVCNLPEEKGYWYSYNFKPNVLDLDRDRSAVDEFYLQLAASKLIEESGNIELLMEMANENAADISGYHEPVTHYSYGYGYSSDGGYDADKIKKIAVDGFFKKNGENAYPLKPDLWGEEKKAVIQTAISLGLNPVETKKVIYNNLPSELKNKLNIKELKGKISDNLDSFLSANKKHMRSKPVKALAEIIKSIRITGG